MQFTSNEHERWLRTLAKYLYKLGHWAVSNKKKVIGGSLGILIVAAILALSIGPSFEDNMEIPGTQSSEAGKIIEKAFPDSEQTGGQVQLVMKAPKNKTLESSDVNQIIQKTLKDIQKDKAVESTATPSDLGTISQDKKIGYAVITYKVPSEKVTEASKEKVENQIKKIEKSGITAGIAGDVAFSEIEIGGITEAIGIIAAFLVLALTFTSFLIAGMPILTAIIGLGIGLMAIMIGTNVADITSFSLSLSAMLGLAVGIDYALFIFSRFRQELKKGHPTEEAIAIATGTAGSAVVFAGITVIIALLGLAVARIPFLTMMGVSASLCVFIAILVAIVLVPAILGVMKHHAGPDRQNPLLAKIMRTNYKEESKQPNKWGRFITNRPLPVALCGIVLLSVITIPFFQMELGLPDNGTKSPDSTERIAYDLLSDGFGEGVHANLVIAAELDTPENSEAELEEVLDKLRQLPQVQSVNPPIPSTNPNIYMISMTPKTGPNDVETKELVHDIRKLSNRIEDKNHLKLMVTGTTAVNIDISEKLNDALPLFATLIVGFAFLLLVMVFRSLLVPLKAVLGFLLSLGATLGFVVFVIQDGHMAGFFGFHSSGPVLAFLPVIVIGILFGLAMDYEVFLVSRMREEYTHSGNAKNAILVGMKDSGGVVTAAGLIMMAVFLGFMFAPDPIIKSMGFALTFGVLFDAFIVRMTIVPAVMSLMGNAAWYLPKWLDKILPNIDVEGEAIIRHKVDNE